MSSSPITRESAATAVEALIKWMRGRSATSKPQLLLDERDEFIILQLSLHRIPTNTRVNPYLLPIPHSLFPISDPTMVPSVCLLIDDLAPNSPSPSSFLEKAKELNIPISDSIGISTLRTDYRPYESRRKLCGSHDLFLADKRIITMLPKFLGKAFYEKKKNPLSVNFSRPGWPEQIKRVLNSTFMYIRSGTCIGIRVGRLCMEVNDIVDNMMQVIDEAVENVPKKWANVRSLHVKAVDSLALPIYQALPEIGLKIEIGGEKENLDAGEVLTGDENAVEEKSEKSSQKKGKGKKKKKGGVRYMDDGVGLIGEEFADEEGDEGENEKTEKRKTRAKDGEEENKIKKKKKEENEGEDVKAKNGNKGKGKLDGQNVKGKTGKLEGQNVKPDKKGKSDKLEGQNVKAGKTDKLEVQNVKVNKKGKTDKLEVQNVKVDKKGKKDNSEVQNVKEDKEKMKKRGKGEIVEAAEKKVKKTKLRV